jgi:Transcription factor WhiB
VEAVQVPSVLSCLDASPWREQAACRDAGVEFIISDYELDRRWPGSPTLVLPMLICARCPVRRECLREALSPMRMPSEREAIYASGVWGATTTIERRAVTHLPLEEAIDRLEAELPERVAGHVRAFHAAGYNTTGGAASRKVRRIRRMLTEAAVRLAANGNGHSKAAQSAQEPSSASA